MRIRHRRTRLDDSKSGKFNLDIKNIIIFAAIIVAVIVAVNVGSYLISTRNISRSYLSDSDTVRIGLRTDISPFGMKDAGGEITGFDKDIIDDVLNEVLTSEKTYEYVELRTEDSCSSMKYDSTEVGIGFLVQGSDRVEGWTISDPYYYDNVVAVVKKDGNVRGLSDLDGKQVGILNSMITVKTADDFFKDKNMDCEVLRYYDYESARIDIESGKVAAVLVPKAFVDTYFAEQGALSDEFFTVGYCIVMPTNQSAVCAEVNKAINMLKNDGTIEQLCSKWGLPYDG